MVIYDCIVIHYGEIGLKGKNRDFFEKKLVENIKEFIDLKSIYRLYGRIICDLKENYDFLFLKDNLLKIPGIEYFSFAKKCDFELNNISRISLDLLDYVDFKTFRVSTRRSNKIFKYTSMDLDIILGQKILDNFSGTKVNLKNYDLELNVEVTEKNVFLYLDKIRGIGGLPVGVSGKVICSLSGGIDSPVSSYMMMKRGCKVVFVHIYNDSVVGNKVLSKIKNLVKVLNDFQKNSKLYIVPFSKIQREIIAVVEPKYRMIVYRRYMFRIINYISLFEKSKAIVTGDSVGQVASQTLDNLNCIYSVIDYPVFSPLIGFNKEEIMNIAKKIGTYEISVEPYPDCCSFMIPKSPSTNAKSFILEKLELKIDNSLIEESVKVSEIINF